MKRLIVGYSNCEAISLAEDFINNSSKNILWIYGKSGYGKTELANYLIRRFKDNHKETCSLTTEELIGFMIQLFKAREPLTSLISCYQDYDLLIFDNVDLPLKEKPNTQQELKNLILEITKNGRTKVILITNKRPRKLKNLMFNTQYCYYTHLKIPTTDFKIDLLNNWAFQNKIFIPRNIITGMAKTSKDLFQLKGLFHQVHFKYNNL